MEIISLLFSGIPELRGGHRLCRPTAPSSQSHLKGSGWGALFFMNYSTCNLLARYFTSLFTSVAWLSPLPPGAVYYSSFPPYLTTPLPLRPFSFRGAVPTTHLLTRHDSYNVSTGRACSIRSNPFILHGKK